MDVLISEGVFHGQPSPVRLQAHVAEESYRHGNPRQEIVPLSAKSGTRTYVLARPYIEEPQVSVVMEVFPRPSIDGAIGRVVRAEQTGTRPRLIGKAQAWYYPADRTTVLWECFLEREYTAGSAPDDPNLHGLWDGFERFLLDRFPNAEQLVTPSWEPLYEPDQWRRFLATRGFAEVGPKAFARALTPPR
ncbi:MAG: hypothetical protein ACRDI2_21300 [Chloroflexota bacterium]